MRPELDSLIRKLDRKANIDWLEEMRLGKPAYDHMLACVRANTLNRNQMANALLALFRIRGHGSEDEVFSLLRAHATHSEIRVRSQAVCLLIGMMKLHDLRAPFQPATCISEIKAAIALGLWQNAASLASDFVAKHGAT